MKTLAILILSSLLVGCAVYPQPNAPPVSTDKGRGCIQECQRNYSECMKGAMGGSLLVISNCNQMLEDCYKLCDGQ